MMFEEEDEDECQCGHGLAGFKGVRYQKGFGLLGSLFAKALPYLKQFGKYIGKKLLGIGSEIAGDVAEGKPIKESVKKRFKSSASVVAKDGMTKLQDILQNGNGKRRRALKKKKVVKHKGKVCKKIKKPKRKTNKRKTVKRKSKSSTLSFLS
jgi:hypothetical protein